MTRECWSFLRAYCHGAAPRASPNRSKRRGPVYNRVMLKRPSYLWDYDIDEAKFREIVAGRKVLGRLDRR